MIPPVAESEDPTTQIPWPAARGRDLDPADDVDSHQNREAPTATITSGDQRTARAASPKRRFSTWDLITLSISMGGAQIAWTVELGYGTPFLLDLGLKEHLTSLVWLAGPISGLVAQPLIGALSDASSSKYRRRFWIGLSTVALVISTLTLAYCQEIAAFCVDVLGVGAGDWAERRQNVLKWTAIGFAIVSFYVLDFALNGLQASLRNLLLDVTPPGQLSSANAWHGRMTNAGNIVGFGFVWITCANHHEEERPKSHRRQGNTMREVFSNIATSVKNLPKPIRRVCFVQLCAFMGWFPFLFYSTTYMGQIMAYEQNKEPDAELATRTGELAMLIYSVVGVCAGTILPHLATRDRRLMGAKTDVDEDAEISRLRAMVRQWRVDAARRGQELHLPVMPFLLRNIWTGALLFFSLLTLSTFFISTVVQLLKEPPPPNRRVVPDGRRPVHARNISNPVRPSFTSERQPLIRRRSFDEYENAVDEEILPGAPLPGGTILGIHNLSIVLPQLLVALVTSIIFRVVDGPETQNAANQSDSYYGKNGVAWALRFGGLCTILGAILARRVPPTPTEKAMRRRLGEMKLLGEEVNP
ncbi:General alpha-glucoside permease [Psilocybe cubensis]|uniref:General alpha-glucoside permease n=1 Tax=Psilocybe cubensis TaxID=181762 RepID=A0ACB8H314_PSICU|nr:General alpha-glucoside permease [Psilocybe cubensis]KAH9482373.1 General alpha-glucoside permease [Psilocybe cubensis]